MATETPSQVPAWQTRVIAERDELKTRATALSTFIGTSEEFAQLQEIDRELLKEQCETMWEYFEILEKRIARF